MADWDIVSTTPDYGATNSGPRNIVPPYKSTMAPGMSEPANVELWNRPVLDNQDGSYSTTLSASDELEPGTEVVYPQVVNGQKLSRDAAIQRYYQTGEHLGKFTGPDRAKRADEYATALHNTQQGLGTNKPKGPWDVVSSEPDNGDRPPSQSAASPTTDYLTHAAQSGFYSLVGAGGRILGEAYNQIFGFTDEELEKLKKADPTFDPEKIALGYTPGELLKKGTAALEQASTEMMRNVSPEAQAKYGELKWSTTDPKKAAWASPTRIAGDVLQNLPTVVAMGVMGRFGGGAGSRAYTEAIMKGATEAEARQAAIKAAANTVTKVGAVSEGTVGYAQQAMQTEQQVMELPQEKIEKSPEYQELIGEGFDKDTARRLLAKRAGNLAGLLAGTVDAATNLATGPVFGRIIGEGGSLIPRTAKGFATEALQEGVQGTGEQLGQNVAVRLHADPEQGFWDDVAENAVQSFALGGLLGGPTAALFGAGHGRPTFTLDDIKGMSAEEIGKTYGLNPDVAEKFRNLSLAWSTPSKDLINPTTGQPTSPTAQKAKQQADIFNAPLPDALDDYTKKAEGEIPKLAPEETLPGGTLDDYERGIDDYLTKHAEEYKDDLISRFGAEEVRTATEGVSGPAEGWEHPPRETPGVTQPDEGPGGGGPGATPGGGLVPPVIRGQGQGGQPPQPVALTQPGLSTGALLKSKTGRSLSPVPKVITSTDKNIQATNQRTDAWLYKEARQEVKDDKLGQKLLRGINPRKLTPNDRAILNTVLFGDETGPSPGHLVEAPATSAIASTPSFMRAPAYQRKGAEEASEEKVGIGADMERMLELFGPKMYGGDLPQVTVKELLQNAFDGLKDAYKQGLVANGKGVIVIRVNGARRTITVSDNGAGMSPEIVKKAFLTLAGTEKGLLGEEEASGGFGLAKLAFIFGNNGLKLTTVNSDGLESSLDTNSKELKAGIAKLATKKAAKGAKTGTSVQITIPETYKGSDGEPHDIHMPSYHSSFDILNKPLIGNVEVRFENAYSGSSNSPEQVVTDVLKIGKHQDMVAMPHVSTVHFPWGDIDMYLGPQKPGQWRTEHYVLSSGIYQFDYPIEEGPGVYKNIPYNLYFNVKSKVKPTDTYYPFNNQREGWSLKIAKDIGQLVGYIQLAYIKEKARKFGGNMFDAEMMPITRTTERAFKEKASNRFESPNIKQHMPKEYEGGKLKLDKDITIKNGETYVGNIPKDVKPTAQDIAGVKIENFTLPPEIVPNDRPYFHNNLNVDIIKEAAKRLQEYGYTAADVRHFFAAIGTVVQDFRDALAKVTPYEQWADKGKVTGISLDKSYYGVHIGVPFHAFFLNPLAARWDNVEANVRNFTHTLLHEGVHTFVSKHTEEFTKQLSELESIFEDKHPNLRIDFENKFADILIANATIYDTLREIYNDPGTTNVIENQPGVTGKISIEPRRPEGLPGGTPGVRAGEQLAEGVRAGSPADGGPPAQGSNVQRPNASKFGTTPGAIAQEHALEVARRETEAMVGASNPLRPIARGLKGRALTDADKIKYQSLIAQVHKLVARMAPSAKVLTAKELQETGGGEVSGAAFERMTPEGVKNLIAWSVRAGDPTKVARHEVVHALRRAGLFRTGEWQALEQAARDGNWISLYNIDTLYPDLPHGAQIEEAIAERFSEWLNNRALFVPKAIRPFFQRLAQLVMRIRAAVKDIYGGRLTADEIMARIEAGSVGSRASVQAAQAQTQFARRRPTTGGLGPQPGVGVTPAPAPTPKPPSWAVRILGEGTEYIGQKLYDALDKYLPQSLDDYVYDMQLGVAPMSAGTPRARKTAQDFASALRAIRNQWRLYDEFLVKNFDRAARKAMWDAADEESVLRQQGQTPTATQGLNKLTAEERAVVTQLQLLAERTFNIAKSLNMTNAAGLPSYAPRMMVEIARAAGQQAIVRRWRGGGVQHVPGDVGRNVQTTTGQLKQRKYLTAAQTEAAGKARGGANIEIVRDIRTLGLAISRLEQAIAGRTLIERIKNLGKQVGVAATTTTATAPGTVPDPNQWFTLPYHPAFKQWGPDFIKDPTTGRVVPRVDQAGNMVWKESQLYILKEFEGPLNAVLSKQSGAFYNAIMKLKGKTMSIIMFSPLIHNAVIWGKAIPAAPMEVFRGPLSFIFGGGIYRTGAGVIADRNEMRTALNDNVDPIGKRYFNQDITTIAEEAEGNMLRPGHSVTAQVAAFIPGLFDKGASEKVKEAIDQAGEVWHNKLLWNKVFQLQMGIYKVVKDKEMKRGLDADSAGKVAAHFANRYAGALPMESMSKLARQFANVLLFSRSFTLSNLGAFKDLVQGLPRGIQAQVLEKAGQAQLNRVQGVARRKAAGMLAFDIGLSYMGLWMAAQAMYWLRAALLDRDEKDEFVPPSENEPGKEKRFLIGYQDDGTAIYGRLPTGKVGEELVDWMTEPTEELKRKFSLFSRFVYSILGNDAGYGQKLFDETDKTSNSWAQAMGGILWNIFDSVVPMYLAEGVYGLATGTGDPTTNALKSTLPMAGITISRGAPGGPAVGEYYSANAQQQFRIQKAMPGWRDQIKNGDEQSARQSMRDAGLNPYQIQAIVRSTKNPRLRLSPRRQQEFNRFATPEQRERMNRARQRENSQAVP